MHEGRWTHSFEIPVNHPEFVKVARTRRDLRKLRLSMNKGKDRGETAIGGVPIANDLPLDWTLHT